LNDDSIMASKIKFENKDEMTSCCSHSSQQQQDKLESQKLIWIKEQELIASLVKVHSDPTIVANQNIRLDNEKSFLQVVEETSWCKILCSPTPTDPSSTTSNNCRYFGGVDIGWPNPQSTSCNSHSHEKNKTSSPDDPQAVAVYVIIDAQTMEIIYRDHQWILLSDLPPYVSTFLAFREIAPLESLVQKQMSKRPDLNPLAILVDGNGIFHPRHAGIACFLGVRTNIPTIGIGKTLLWIENKSNETSEISNKTNNDGNNIAKPHGIEEYQWTRSKLDERIDMVLADIQSRIWCGNESELIKSIDNKQGLIYFRGYMNKDIVRVEDARSRQENLEHLARFCNGVAIPLEAPKHDRFEYLGAALVGHGRGQSKNLRSSGSKRPIIVSIGHKMSLAEATAITADLSLFRIPEPVRQADLYGRELLRQRNML